ncbi:MAG: hypothetical protein Q4C66_07595, partial [Lachnospiraceae bacterium]|nr:hypothetical protein [Lachnospiraceae bacterium]
GFMRPADVFSSIQLSNFRAGASGSKTLIFTHQGNLRFWRMRCDRRKPHPGVDSGWGFSLSYLFYLAFYPEKTCNRGEREV